MVTDAQVRRLRERQMDGNTVGAAAAAAGMCERTAQRWQEGPFPSATKTARTWRTRVDPFEDLWATEVVPPARCGHGAAAAGADAVRLVVRPVSRAV